MISTPTRAAADNQHDERSRPRRRRWRRLRLVMLVVTVLAGTVVGASVVGALRAPGTDSAAARLAEWGRDHGFDGLITWLEKQQYDHTPPPTGGAPLGGIPRVVVVPATPSDPRGSPGLPPPPALHRRWACRLYRVKANGTPWRRCTVGRRCG
jgi:hypothetical protein